MRVVVVGSGGREACLAHVLARTADVVVTPGNPGIPGSVATPPEDLDADLFVIGPEQPLVDGLADRLRAQGKRVFGPGADGARLEGSKAYMKELVQAAGVPTAGYGAFDDRRAGCGASCGSCPPPYVVKTDGLAAGKGVLVTNDLAEAEADVRAKLSGDAFGVAGRTVVIEEGMRGPEVSVFAVCDGQRAVALAPGPGLQAGGRRRPRAQHRRHGRLLPAAVARRTGFADDVIDRFVQPTLAELRRRGIDYRGVLYTGLMVTDGRPQAGGVQRPLRRPRQPGGAPAAHLRPRRPVGRRRRRAATARCPPTDGTLGCAGGGGGRGLPRRRSEGRPDRRSGGRAAGRRRHGALRWRRRRRRWPA